MATVSRSFAVLSQREALFLQIWCQAPKLVTVNGLSRMRALPRAIHGPSCFREQQAGKGKKREETREAAEFLDSSVSVVAGSGFVYHIAGTLSVALLFAGAAPYSTNCKGVIPQG